MDTEQLSNAFKAQYGNEPERIFFAPGRVNLIGEYTDFNGGHVFPAAISLGTYAAVAPNTSNSFNLYSGNFVDDGVINIPFDQLKTPKEKKWTDYFKGMAQVLVANGAKLTHGLDVYVYGNLPNSAGLSSSASLELLVGTIINSIYGSDFPMLSLVKFGKEVENKYIGVNSGIMDQFAIGMGSIHEATFLDTNTLDYESVPIELGNNVILIMNTNKHRELADSKYNERRAQCEEALARLQTKLNIKSLGELDEETFDEYSYLIYDDILIRRARHAVVENQRTIKAVAALKSNNLETFSRLISASGVSLAYDFEVTGKELDTLVQTALKQPGVLGARMTGAGFGGCAIAIVDKEAVPAVKKAVSAVYKKEIGYDADFYVADIVGGPKAL